MRRELDFQQLQLSSYCTQQIESLIGQGLSRMQLANALNNAGFVMRAERNLKGLVRYLGKHARKVGSYPTLSDKDFDEALRKSPAFWPFCMSG